MARVLKIVAGIIIVGYLILQLLSFGFQRRGNLRAPERFIVALTSPGQRAMEFVISWVGGITDHYFALVGTSKLNEVLLKERDELKTELVSLKELELENERLRQLLSLGKPDQIKILGAERIAMGPSPYEKVARINRGKSNGLAPGMAVIHPRGVVGQVIAVTEETGDVLLLVDRASAIDVVSQRSRARGILRGNGFGDLHFEYLPRNEDIQVGDEIITSGLDGVYPKGLPVGSVTSVNKSNETQLFVAAKVDPHVNFGDLMEIAVVTNVGKTP